MIQGPALALPVFQRPNRSNIVVQPPPSFSGRPPVVSSGGGGQVATPSFSPVAGSYGPTQNVTITSATAGASIYYTTNGVDPTISDTPYTVPVAVASSLTLKALAVKAGLTDSAIGSAAYTINGQVATPTFSGVAAGTYGQTQSVTLACATGGASIYYTTDGTTPDNTKTLYSAAFDVSATATVKAIGIKTAFSDSGILSGAFTISRPTGGTITTSGGMTIHAFDSSATFTTFATMDITRMVNGSGGAGAGADVTHAVSGGGGGGEVLTGTFTALGAGAYPVVVGAGGTAASGASGGAGNASSVNSISANPGQGGKMADGSSAPAPGAGGASGGGATGGTQGTSGNFGGGGGAGAGNGGNGSSTAGGAGAAGTSSSITGSAVVYGSGAGGGTYNGGTAGVGGSGAGNGGTPGGGNGNAGSANRGGGGGGAASAASPTVRPGGNGGSGKVVLAYTT